MFRLLHLLRLEADMTAMPSVVPEDGDVELARAALRILASAVDADVDAHAPVTLKLAKSGEEVVVPKAILNLLGGALENLARGEGVTLVPANAELTTQQAAELLNVSRPFVIRLLDEGKIEHRLVGTHRRVKTSSLLAYLRADDEQRKAAADELSAMTHALGFA
ncbi:MAG: helix-turn-helix domain-containing protein [Nocardioides sp.]|uniref:helix-turn-helix domain-containing protein n=1 Tax=Nocardioides sp. TaxID=35761 RepID=UPI0039E236F1